MRYSVYQFASNGHIGRQIATGLEYDKAKEMVSIAPEGFKRDITPDDAEIERMIQGGLL